MSPLFSPVGSGGIGKATVNAVTGATATLRNSDGKNYYQFNGSGSISVNSGTVGLFLVGGGGAGGSAGHGGGGGGGGGVVSLNAEYLAAGTYTVAAGAGGNSGNGYNQVVPGNGSDSYIGNITAVGGGFGGTVLRVSNYYGFPINPGRGGSGGGAFGGTGIGYCGGNYGVGLGVTNQGKSGGPTQAPVVYNNSGQNGGGGGGGYSAVGGTGSYVIFCSGNCSTNPLGGSGGQGGNFTITNATVIYGSGGGASSGQTPAGTGGTNGGNGGVGNAGNSGTAGNGSGGGSSASSTSATAISGAGGSGTVIVVVG
jgi:hypothetical protein